LAYITSSYTYINISYILSQHIDRINNIIINKKKTYVNNIRISKRCILIYIYISRPLWPSECLHTKNTYARRLVPHLGTKSAHQPIYNQKGIQYTSIRVPRSHPQLLLPQEEVVAQPHLPQAVVVEHR
jgi:hypothetical protein